MADWVLSWSSPQHTPNKTNLSSYSWAPKMTPVSMKCQNVSLQWGRKGDYGSNRCLGRNGTDGDATNKPTKKGATTPNALRFFLLRSLPISLSFHMRLWLCLAPGEGRFPCLASAITVLVMYLWLCTL